MLGRGEGEKEEGGILGLGLGAGVMRFWGEEGGICVVEICLLSLPSFRGISILLGVRPVGPSLKPAKRALMIP